MHPAMNKANQHLLYRRAKCDYVSTQLQRPPPPSLVGNISDIPVILCPRFVIFIHMVNVCSLYLSFFLIIFTYQKKKNYLFFQVLVGF
jgi:hypothetical protein